MASIVFVVGTINLVLGFVLALALERPIVLYLPARRGAPIDPTADRLPEPPSPPASEAALDQVPDQWLTMLERVDAEFHTFAEASVHVLRLEADMHRNDLMDIEDLVRSAVARRNPDAIHDAVQELVAMNDEWVVRLQDASRVMASKRDELGAHTDLGHHLEALLVDQASAIQTRCQEIAGADPKSDEEAGEKIVRELTQLARLAHTLRDAIDEAATAIIVREGRGESSDRAQLVDQMTGLRNRLAIELQLGKWWREDPDHQRCLSLALVDVERLGRTNEFASTRVVDRLLQALANLLSHQVSRDSGYDRVFRYNGHQFLLFFGDAGYSAAAATVERIRQAVEATLFEFKGKQYALTVRAGVTAVRPGDDSEQLWQRLADLVARAKQEGGNRTRTDDGSAAAVAPPDKGAGTTRTVMIE